MAISILQVIVYIYIRIYTFLLLQTANISLPLPTAACNLGAILNMDSFSVKYTQFTKDELPNIPTRPRKAQFLCREASIIILGYRGTISKSTFFTLLKRHYQMYDLKTICYATHHLHGLDMQPTNTE